MATIIGGGVGQIAFASDRSGMPEIWIVDVDGTDLHQLTQIREGACQPDWSPDGKHIVFVSPCEKNQETYPGSGLFIIDVEGGKIVPLPSAPGGDFDPDWSPDGKQIAFTSLREGGMKQIFIINLDDNSILTLAEENPRENTLPKWSPDGKRLLFVGSDNRFWSMSPDGNDRFAVGGVTGDYLEASEQ